MAAAAAIAGNVAQHAKSVVRGIARRDPPVSAGPCVPSAIRASCAEKQVFCYSAYMKTTLTVTSRGVVTLPAKLRRAMGLKADDQLIAETTPEGLLLRPAVTLPIEMYSDERIREFDAAEDELARVLGKRSTKKRAR
jgi:AbrB family looped-hinge helix DNA binding protein